MTPPRFKVGDRVSLRRWYEYRSPKQVTLKLAEVIAVTPTRNYGPSDMVRCKISPTLETTLDQNWLEEA